ncbi:MAG: DUF5522 domain-containing protein [Chitinophagales bacterium]
MKQLIKNTDYYINEQGYWVFTAKYLSERGFCCGSGCRHCPYDEKRKNRKHIKKTAIPKKMPST